MKFLDKLAEISFKTDREGRTVYFPNGIFGKGFILPDSDSKAKALKFNKRQLPISFFVGFLTGIFLFSKYFSLFIKIPIVITILGIFSFIVIKSQRKIIGNFESATKG
jgi:hypothetical protein